MWLVHLRLLLFIDLSFNFFFLIFSGKWICSHPHVNGSVGTNWFGLTDRAVVNQWTSNSCAIYRPVPLSVSCFMNNCIFLTSCTVHKLNICCFFYQIFYRSLCYLIVISDKRDPSSFLFYKRHRNNKVVPLLK